MLKVKFKDTLFSPDNGTFTSEASCTFSLQSTSKRGILGGLQSKLHAPHQQNCI